MLIRTLICLFVAAAIGTAADAPWATYRGNAQRTGNTDNLAGPAKPHVMWALRSDEHFVASPVPNGAGVLFASLGAFNKPNIQSIPMNPTDTKTVKPLWVKSVPFLKQPLVSSPALADDKVLFGEGMHQTDGATLYCIPADGGYPLWTYNVPGELVHMEGSPAVANGRVYVGAGSAGVICVDLTKVTLDGKELDVKDVPPLQVAKWKELLAKYEVDKKKDPDFAVPPTEADMLKPTPKLHWNMGKGKWHADAPLLVAGDKVLVASAFLDKEKLGVRALFCLDANTGKELWNAPLNYNPWGGPTLAGDTVIVTTSTIAYDVKQLGATKGEIHAIDLATGKERWKKAVPGGILGCAAVNKDAAVFTAADGKLRVFSLKDGSRLTIYDCKAPCFAPPALVGDVAYIGDLKGVIHAVDIKTGNAIWTLDVGQEPINAPGMHYGGITVHGGKVYVGTCNLEGEFVRKPTAVICIGAK